ncbi:MAG: 23S rRNA (adenine(2503)-C(2))-methyltransferase RlmN [Nitrospiraceae bacterium]|nr:MAG: 23S rRNA (adenine(2503)-C(2))-methyltransferase RlmN [Nitrospiraceae bacterium]
MKTNLKQLSKQELFHFMEQSGQKKFRTNQIISWLYIKLAASFDEMTDLSKDFRRELNKSAFISNLILLKRLESKDGTQKFLFELEDGQTIESVLIPNSKGEGRFTLCISSQVGCAVGCEFCMTARLGLKRNLKAYEIVDQVIAVKRLIAQQSSGLTPAPLIPSGNEVPDEPQKKAGEKPEITNIVFMGMGEPFNNFNEVSQALLKLTDLMGYSRRKITVSTSGIVPGIRKLGEIKPLVNLAVSLNATTDEVRNRIMPINRKYPLKELIRACREFPIPPRNRITFEYVMLEGMNDTDNDARRLVKLLSGINSKVNLIPHNPLDLAGDLHPPSESRVLAFQNILKKAGITTIIRKSMGGDISAACGQLKAAYKAE